MIWQGWKWGGGCDAVCLTIQALWYLSGPELEHTKAPRYLRYTLAANSVDLIQYISVFVLRTEAPFVSGLPVQGWSLVLQPQQDRRSSCIHPL